MTKYLISSDDLQKVNTFHSSSPQTIEVVDGKQELFDYLRWCQLSERMATLDEYLKKYPTYVYELSGGMKLVSISELEYLKK